MFSPPGSRFASWKPHDSFIPGPLTIRSKAHLRAAGALQEFVRKRPQQEREIFTRRAQRWKLEFRWKSNFLGGQRLGLSWTLPRRVLIPGADAKPSQSLRQQEVRQQTYTAVSGQSNTRQRICQWVASVGSGALTGGKCGPSGGRCETVPRFRSA